MYYHAHLFICSLWYFYEINKAGTSLFEGERKVRFSPVYRLTGSHLWTVKAGSESLERVKIKQGLGNLERM